MFVFGFQNYWDAYVLHRIARNLENCVKKNRVQEGVWCIHFMYNENVEIFSDELHTLSSASKNSQCLY